MSALESGKQKIFRYLDLITQENPAMAQQSTEDSQYEAHSNYFLHICKRN